MDSKVATNLLSPVRRVRPVVLLFLFFGLFAVLISWDSLEYPFFYDDLHLIREFSGPELASTFSGSWDVDGIETTGYRPLTTLFNHLRYLLFGENVLAHRLFQISLFAIYLSALCWIARQFGMSWAFSALSACLLLLARYNISHAVWITDGIHAFQAALFGLSLSCLLLFLRSRRFAFLIASLCLATMNVYAREDSLLLVVITILLGYVYVAQLGRMEFSLMHVYTIGCCVIVAAYLTLRSVFLPALDAFPPIFPQAILTLSESVFGLTGITAFDAPSRFLLSAWPFVLLFLVFIMFFKRYSQSFIWFACFAVALLGLMASGFVRTNLLLFPLTFFCLFLASQLEMAYLCLRYGKGIAVLLAAWLLASALYFRGFALESLHPKSTTWIRANAEFIYGEFSPSATISAQRKLAIKALLAEVDIFRWEDVAGIVEHAKKYRQPNAAGAVFTPYIDLFTP